MNKGAYFANFIVASTILGGVALQMKDVARGRDPRPINEKFIIAAMAQGGGWGIFGDFLFSDMNRYGRGGMSTLLGPIYGFGKIPFGLRLEIFNNLQRVKILNLLLRLWICFLNIRLAALFGTQGLHWSEWF